MMDVQGFRVHGPTINCASQESALSKRVPWDSVGNAAWPSANMAFYVPFEVYHTIKIERAGYRNNNATGNVDLGVYDAHGTRLAHTGSTAIPGSNVLHSIALSLTLTPGIYYMAMAYDGTGNISRYSSSSTLQRMITTGCYQEASAFPLPATATFATLTNNYIPTMGLSQRSGFF